MTYGLFYVTMTTYNKISIVRPSFSFRLPHPTPADAYHFAVCCLENIFHMRQRKMQNKKKMREILKKMDLEFSFLNGIEKIEKKNLVDSVLVSP